MFKTKKRLVFSLVLALSLAANVFLVGHGLGKWAGGACLTGKEKSWRQHEKALTARLSSEDISVFKAHKAENRARFHADREKVMAARQAVEDILRAELLDTEALARALEAEKQAKADMLLRMRESRDVLMDKLSPEGRAEFREILADKPLYRQR